VLKAKGNKGGAQKKVICGEGAMFATETQLQLLIGLLFMVVGLTLAARIKGAQGSLRYAKASVVMAALSVSAAFIIQVIMAFVYDPSSLNQNLLVKQLYVFEDLFAMLVLAFLGSFAIYSTYAGPRRKWIIALIFLIALIPPIYLTLDYAQATVALATDVVRPFDFTSPPLTKYFYAICGIPLGVTPVLMFARSLVAAIRRKDRVSTNRTAIMFSAVIANEAEYLLYVFAPFIEIAVVIAWIPAALLLLFAVLRITSPIPPTD
jgi:hypothetical protein